MGLASSSSGSVPQGKALVSQKIATAEKTGILNLSSQKLKLTSKVWSQLPLSKLKTLDVSDNSLTPTLPPEVGSQEMVLLKVLHASNNKLTQIHDMSNLTKLSTLNLDHNYLVDTSLPALSLPPQLRVLNLSYNKFTSFRQCSGLLGLLNLAELDLSNNLLTTLEGLSLLVSIVILRLDNNRISEVPADMSMCSKLKLLSLRNNVISGKGSSGQQSIPASVFTDTCLEQLLLSGNPMLSRLMVYDFQGVDSFVERRRRSKDRNLAGGAADDSENIFGTDLK
eukprot:GSChrysophyteH2.ASY1.ANO1.202.1 assembled CDS